MRLTDKVAIVTGGGRGIGKAIALRFAAEGAAVTIAARSVDKMNEVVAEIKAKGGKALAIPTDVSKEVQIQDMVARTVKEFGKIDILVNNSGVAGPTVKVVDLKLADWNEVLATDLTGSMLCCREVLKYMIPKKSGVIVNIGSEGGRAGDGKSGYPMRVCYSCSKMGIIGLTETLSVEVGEYNIRVNCITPAAVKGERIVNVVKNRAAATGATFESLWAQIVANYSLKRAAEESEIASVAVFLATDESSCITGQTIPANCGQHMIF